MNTVAALWYHKSFKTKTYLIFLVDLWRDRR